MGQTVLVDGNNLLYAALDAEPDRPPGRAALCGILGEWARRTRARVRVVFDGLPPDSGLRQQISDPDVSVLFSGSSASADRVLGEMIRTSSAGKLMLVVSSDREVARVARRHRARSMRSDEFWRRIQHPPADSPAAPDEKLLGSRDDDETQRWLNEFGFGTPEADQP